MEERINVAELLKDCPKGMELDCTMFEDVKFISVEEDDKPICIRTGDIYRYLTKFGTWTFDDNAKCVIFPKGKTTWKGFVPPCEFKDGDIVATTDGCWIGITEGGRKNEFIPTYCVIKTNGEFEAYFEHKEKWSFNRLATEEEKEKLFKAIKEHGYKWNAETKTLEKLVFPKFKVGDRIKLKNTPTNNILTVTKTNDDGSLNVNMYSWVIKYELQDEYELVLNNQPKFKVGDKIKKKGDTRLTTIKDVIDDCYIITFPDYFGHCYITDKLSFSNQGDYELAPNKFDITTLKAFESRVLVRDSTTGIWYPEFFVCLFNSNNYPYMVLSGNRWKYCVPYEGNEHLLNTNNDCDEYYKTWE